MNKLISMLMLFLLGACSNEVIRNDASIDFADRQHDFGTIPFKKATSYVFEFTNQGKTPSLVSDVKTSCGCTVPEWPNKPILPGEKGLIKINYDAHIRVCFTKPYRFFTKGRVRQWNWR